MNFCSMKIDYILYQLLNKFNTNILIILIALLNYL